MRKKTPKYSLILLIFFAAGILSACGSKISNQNSSISFHTEIESNTIVSALNNKTYNGESVTNGRITAICPDGYEIDKVLIENNITFNKKLMNCSFTIAYTSNLNFGIFDNLTPNNTFLLKDAKDREFLFNVYKLEDDYAVAEYTASIPWEDGFIQIWAFGIYTPDELTTFLNGCDWH